MAVPPNNEGRGTSDDTRATTSTGAANPNRGTDNKGTAASDVLKQEPEYASTPGPLMRMLQAVDAASLLTVDSLMLTTVMHHQIPLLYNLLYFGGNATERLVTNWAGALKELSTYRSINTLALLLESKPGNLLFYYPTTDRWLTTPLVEAGQRFSKLKRKPKIGTLNLECCNLGLDLDSVVDFGLALNADVVMTINCFHKLALKTFDVAKGEDKVLEAQFRRFNGYLVGPSPKGWIGLAREKDVKVTLLLEWFVRSWDDYVRNLPEEGDKARERFYTVGSLKPARIRSEEELAKLKTALASDPIPRRITIDLFAFRKSRGDRR